MKEAFTGVHCTFTFPFTGHQKVVPCCLVSFHQKVNPNVPSKKHLLTVDTYLLCRQPSYIWSWYLKMKQKTGVPHQIGWCLIETSSLLGHILEPPHPMGFDISPTSLLAEVADFVHHQMLHEVIHPALALHRHARTPDPGQYGARI